MKKMPWKYGLFLIVLFAVGAVAGLSFATTITLNSPNSGSQKIVDRAGGVLYPDSDNRITLTTTKYLTDYLNAGFTLTPADIVAANNNDSFVFLDANQTVTNKRYVAKASTTAAAGLNLPHGTAPTAPVDGDVWTTDSGLFFRVNDSTSQAVAMVYPGAGIPVSTGSAWDTSKATPTGVIIGDNDTQTLSGKTLTTPVVASFYQDAGKTKLMTTPNTASDTLAAIAATQTMTNKTLTTPVIASFYQDAGKTQLMTAPNTASDTLVALAATQTLTAKTITSPVITGANVTKSLTILTNDTVLTSTACGKVYGMANDSKLVTLPSTAAGCEIVVFNSGAATHNNIEIHPATVDKIMGETRIANGTLLTILTDDNESVTNTKGTSVRGDFMRLIGDGVDGWYIQGSAGIWAEDTP